MASGGDPKVFSDNRDIAAFVEALHSPQRDDAWLAGLKDLHQKILSAFANDDEGQNREIFQEIVRQRLDESILADVMAAMEDKNPEEFIEALKASYESWKADPIQARTDAEIEANPRAPDAELGLKGDIATKFNKAAKEGDINALVTLLHTLQSQAQPAPQQSAEADQPPVKVHQTPLGNALYDYVHEQIRLANRDFEPHEISENETTFMKMNPSHEQMRENLRMKIQADIKAGRFPVGSYTPDQAEDVAKSISEKIYQNGLKPSDTRIVPAPSFAPKGPNGEEAPKSLYYNFSEENLNTAIDALFAGNNPIIKNNFDNIGSAAFFEQVYLDAMRESGAGLRADDLIERFKELAEGTHIYSKLPDDLPTDEFPEGPAAALLEAHKLVDSFKTPEGSIPDVSSIPADQQEAFTKASNLIERFSAFHEFKEFTLDIPPERREDFYQGVREAFEASRLKGGDLDPEKFGEKLFELYGTMDRSGYAEPKRTDILDFGQPISVKSGEGLNVTTPEGTPLFSFADPSTEGFSLYGLRTDADGITDFEDLTHIDSLEELREVLGDDFKIRIVSKPDKDDDPSNTEAVGYYIEAQGGTFYIGFDAVPESNITPDFQAARAEQADQTMRDPSETLKDGLIAGPTEHRPPPTSFGATL